MKKIAIISFLLLLFTTKVTAHIEVEELEQIASLVLESELEIDSWQVTIKEKMNKDEALTIMEKMKKDYIINFIDNDEMIKYSLTTKSKEIVSETIKIIIPKNNVEIAHFIVELTGSEWDERILTNYQTKLKSLKSDYLSKFARKYVCLNTNSNAIIKSIDFINDINEKLGVIHISTQADTEQHSSYERIVYGYTPLWKQDIRVSNKPINIQIVQKRVKNNQTKLMIGTPILLNEY